MKMYDLNDNEIKMLASWNTETLAAFSVGSFFLSQIVSICLTLAASDQWTAVEQVLFRFGLPCCAAVMIGSYFVGWRLKRSCGEIIQTVKEETEETPHRPARSKRPKPEGVITTQT
ncbi:MAG TPA: hypothetical protein VEU95_00010 [Micropepsaceae bacterium]|nr:hypothetical protein [Micropepsaceae bacterium]